VSLSYPPCILTRAGFDSPFPCSVFSSASSLQPTYISLPIPRPKHFNTEDGGSMFLRNIGVRLQDYRCPNTEEHNLKYGSVYHSVEPNYLVPQIRRSPTEHCPIYYPDLAPPEEHRAGSDLTGKVRVCFKMNYKWSLWVMQYS
jgi:hypothetical protein